MRFFQNIFGRIQGNQHNLRRLGEENQLEFLDTEEERNGFTLFYAAPIDALCEYSIEVSVLGRALKYGKMAYSNETNLEYFGLKIEGDMNNIPNPRILEVPMLRRYVEAIHFKSTK